MIPSTNLLKIILSKDKYKTKKDALNERSIYYRFHTYEMMKKLIKQNKNTWYWVFDENVGIGFQNIKMSEHIIFVYNI